MDSGLHTLDTGLPLRLRKVARRQVGSAGGVLVEFDSNGQRHEVEVPVDTHDVVSAGSPGDLWVLVVGRAVDLLFKELSRKQE